MQHSASGEVFSIATDGITFSGPWGVDSHDCSGGLEDTAWTPDSGDAYTTLKLFEDSRGDGYVVDTWLSHRDLDDTEPLDTPSEEGQWYMTELDLVLEDGTGTWVGSESTLIEGFITLDLYHNLTITVR